MYCIVYSLDYNVHCTVHTVYCTVQYLQCTAVYRIYGVLQCKVHRSVQNIQCTAVYSLYRYYALSQRFFPKRQLSKGIFPSGNFPNVHFFKQQPPKSVLAATLDLPGRSQPQHLAPLSSLRRDRRPNREVALWKMPLRK